MRTCAIIHPLHLELETAPYIHSCIIIRRIALGSMHLTWPQYTLGHLERLNQIEAALSLYGGLILTGAGYRGVGIPDCIRDGVVAAERVVRYLSGERS
jgi:hypothetical protein